VRCGGVVQNKVGEEDVGTTGDNYSVKYLKVKFLVGSPSLVVSSVMHRTTRQLSRIEISEDSGWC